VAYGEIASSIYFALGIVAVYALGFTPLVLLGVGLLFLVVSLSYAEARPPCRRPVVPPPSSVARRTTSPGSSRAGALPRLLIVIALSALFLPHYLSGRSVCPRSIATRGTSSSPSP